jgi:hypothetical protein
LIQNLERIDCVNVAVAVVKNDGVILDNLMECLAKRLPGFSLSRIIVTSRRSSAQETKAKKQQLARQPIFSA